MLRAVDAKTRPDLKRAIPAALLTLASFQFGEGLGGIRRTTPAFFNVFGGAFEVPTPYVKLLVVGAAAVYLIAGLIATHASTTLTRKSRCSCSASSTSPGVWNR